MILFTAFAVYLLVLIGGSEAKQVGNLKKPTKLGSCKAQLDDGRIFDLSSLDKASKPRIANGDDYNYEFNPCSPFQCVSGAAPLAAACQVSKDGSRSYPIGDQSTADFDLDGNTMVITYKSGIRQTELKCVCGKSEQFSFQGEDPTNTYNLVFTHPCCCLDGCKGGSGGGSGGLSFGSILLIIFFVSIFVYFLGGFIFLRFVRKANGLDAVPNRTFWISLPADIKSGVSFTISKVKGGGGSQYQNI